VKLVRAFAFTISIEQGRMTVTVTVNIDAGRAVFSGREQSAFAFPTYQDSMWPSVATSFWSARGACATRFVLTPVGPRTRTPSSQPSGISVLIIRQICVGGQRVGGRPRTMKAARFASRGTRTAYLRWCFLSRWSPMPSLFGIIFVTNGYVRCGRTVLTTVATSQPS